jgi:hypothetical protein
MAPILVCNTSASFSSVAFHELLLAHPYSPYYHCLFLPAVNSDGNNTKDDHSLAIENHFYTRAEMEGNSNKASHGFSFPK